MATLRLRKPPDRFSCDGAKRWAVGVDKIPTGGYSAAHFALIASQRKLSVFAVLKGERFLFPLLKLPTVHMKIPTLKNTCRSGILLACAGFFLSFAQQTNAATVNGVLISLSNAGAWANVSTTQNYVWNFHWNGDSNTDANGSTNYSFSAAGFQLSASSVTDSSAQIRFSLFDASGNSWNSSLVKADIGGALDYFTFGPISPLAAGDYWFTLSSTALAANPFQVKLGSMSMADGADNMSGKYTTDGNLTGTSAIPETSSSIMAAVGVLGMLSFRRRNTAA